MQRSATSAAADGDSKTAATPAPTLAPSSVALAATGGGGGGSGGAAAAAAALPTTLDERIEWIRASKIYQKYAKLGSAAANSKCEAAASEMVNWLEGQHVPRETIGILMWPRLHETNPTNHYIAVAWGTIAIDPTNQQFLGGAATVEPLADWSSDFVRLLNQTKRPARYVRGTWSEARTFGNQDRVYYWDAGGTVLNAAADAAVELAQRRVQEYAAREAARVASAARAAASSSSSSAASGLGASATKGEGSGCCFLTTACTAAMGLPDDCEELTELRAFRDGYLASLPEGPAAIGEYYEIAPAIVDAIDSQPDRNEVYSHVYGVIKACVRAIQENRRAAALEMYRRMTWDLRSRYLA